ncbi:MAG: DUF1294 domain-containing protein [Candidatus Electrothrix sp. ATG2]|nr:DUF1294 domain-containing protein [Candidatus Electrothrix sp. ATG2]
MGCKGRLTSWNDAKGFGFITPKGGGKRIFVHIKSFTNRSQRPEVNQLLSYTLSSDKQGRPCAVHVASPHARRKLKKGASSYAIAFLFLTAVTGAFFAGKIPLLIIGLYFIISLLTFLLYAKDKSAAKKGAWRTSENTLHLFSLVGGWPGALVAQQTLHHKSRKHSFLLVFWITVLLNCCVVAWLLTPNGSLEVQYWIDVRLKFWIDNNVIPFVNNLLFT